MSYPFSSQEFYSGGGGETGLNGFYELKALEFLKMSGYKIIERNYRTRGGEVDVIGRDKDVLAFIEVKARGSRFRVSPEEAVDASKIRKIIFAARCYVHHKNIRRDCRFDVVAIVQGREWRSYRLLRDVFRQGGPNYGL